MGRSGLEIKAQAEARDFFNSVGWCLKPAVEMVCTRCKAFNYPTHTGMFDLLAVIRSDDGPLTIGTEVKATPDDRWSFSDWSAKQRAWALAWKNRTELISDNRFLWIQIQKNRVDSKDIASRRRVWFVPQSLVLDAEQQLLATGRKSIPVNAAARTKGRDNFELELTAERLFHGWELQWVAGYGWWPAFDSSIWQQIRTTYYDPATAREFNEQHPAPDIAAAQCS